MRTDTLEAEPVFFVHALGDFDQQAYDDAGDFVREEFIEGRPLCVADFNGDGSVDLGDFGFFGAAFGSSLGDVNYQEAADFNGDGNVDLGDFGAFGAEFGRGPGECGG